MVSKNSKIECLFGFHKFSYTMSMNYDKIHSPGTNEIIRIPTTTDVTRSCIECNLYESRTFASQRDAELWVQGKI